MPEVLPPEEPPPEVPPPEVPPSAGQVVGVPPLPGPDPPPSPGLPPEPPESHDPADEDADEDEDEDDEALRSQALSSNVPENARAKRRREMTFDVFTGGESITCCIRGQ